MNLGETQTLSPQHDTPTPESNWPYRQQHSMFYFFSGQAWTIGISWFTAQAPNVSKALLNIWAAVPSQATVAISSLGWTVVYSFPRAKPLTPVYLNDRPECKYSLICSRNVPFLYPLSCVITHWFLWFFLLSPCHRAPVNFTGGN